MTVIISFIKITALLIVATIVFEIWFIVATFVIKMIKSIMDKK